MPTLFAKIFRQIYDSTLADDWQALVTFQQLLVLCDWHGVVDMTPQAIHRLTNIPQDIIDQGLQKLVAPDPQSRSRKLNGQRLELIDSERSWGWRIVNYAYYRDLASVEDKRQKDKERIARKRKENKNVALVSQPVANVAHIDLDLDKDKRKIKTLAQNAAHEGFDSFWKAYPKKKSKGQAEKAWIKIKPTKELTQTILSAIERAKTSDEWFKDNGQFIPYPASWLNAKGWEDEIHPRKDSIYA